MRGPHPHDRSDRTDQTDPVPHLDPGHRHGRRGRGGAHRDRHAVRRRPGRDPARVGDGGRRRRRLRHLAAGLPGRHGRGAAVPEGADRRLRPGEKQAVVLDIDNTSLETDFGFSYPQPANRPVLEVAEYAQEHGVALFFVTARPGIIEAPTEWNLAHAGYESSGLYVRGFLDLFKDVAEYKTEQRAEIESKGYTIIANIGNSASDLSGATPRRRSSSRTTTASCPDGRYAPLVDRPRGGAWNRRCSAGSWRPVWSPRW